MAFVRLPGVQYVSEFGALVWSGAWVAGARVAGNWMRNGVIVYAAVPASEIVAVTA